MSLVTSYHPRHNIYRERDAANGAVLNFYEELMESEFPNTMKVENKHGLVSIEIEEEVSYFITVEKRELL